jgi:hypothetical protein
LPSWYGSRSRTSYARGQPRIHPSAWKGVFRKFVALASKNYHPAYGLQKWPGGLWADPLQVSTMPLIPVSAPALREGQTRREAGAQSLRASEGGSRAAEQRRERFTGVSCHLHSGAPERRATRRPSFLRPAERRGGIGMRRTVLLLATTLVVALSISVAITARPTIAQAVEDRQRLRGVEGFGRRRKACFSTSLFRG